MILLLDQGNTNLRWAAVSREDLIRLSGAVAAGIPLESAFVTISRELGTEISQIVVSSVSSGARNQELSAVAAAVFGVRPVFLDALQSGGGLMNGYTEPSRLGVDRWLTMLAARSIWAGCLLVIDAGSAVTVDAVMPSGQHLGGFIVPGFAMQCGALAARTANVGLSLAVPGCGFGRDTQSAVANGVLLGLAALIDRSWRDLREGVDETGALVLTGGDARRIAPLLTSNYVLDETLIFRGMMVQMRLAG